MSNLFCTTTYFFFILNGLVAQGVGIRCAHTHYYFCFQGYTSTTLHKDSREKGWRVSNGNKFAKSSFILDWESGKITCPNQITLPFRSGGKVQFPANTCLSCPKRKKCTTSKKGRSISIHPDEKFIAELRERQLTPTGRAKLRERVAVEHSLSHIGRWQGDKARYLGIRKNLFDLRRTAVVHNLHVLARMFVNEKSSATN